jgi:hypothetical protein
MVSFVFSLSLFLYAVIPFYPSLANASWEKLIEKHRTLMCQECYELLQEQYQAFRENRLPKIAESVIKQIEIAENSEPLLDIKKQAHSRIQMLPDPEAPFASPEQNAGFPESSWIRICLYQKLEKLIDECDRIAPHFGFEMGQIAIRVFEGVRSLKTQESLFNQKVSEISQISPHLTFEECELEASQWVSPVKNNIPAHSTGGAIDIRLFDLKTGQFLDLGKFGVIWDSNPHVPTFSNEISDEQIKNRLILWIAATSAGLVNYPYEYWHFSVGDRYATYWLKPIPLIAVFGGM